MGTPKIHVLVAGLGFSEAKAVRLRNGLSSHEIPFGFGWLIIFIFSFK